jgi:hypothetical protein
MVADLRLSPGSKNRRACGRPPHGGVCEGLRRWSAGHDLNVVLPPGRGPCGGYTSGARPVVPLLRRPVRLGWYMITASTSVAWHGRKLRAAHPAVTHERHGRAGPDDFTDSVVLAVGSSFRWRGDACPNQRADERSCQNPSEDKAPLVLNLRLRRPFLRIEVSMSVSKLSRLMSKSHQSITKEDGGEQCT